ncbi:MAG: TetR/AcrR family transcriptional regulator [Acidobacteria bacterium]|nr:TetR/AcrR family transcriptional regulator [Acidobacteriota bacterium]
MARKTEIPSPIDKGEAILQAALELFSERGFHGTAMPLVSERAGVSAGTIYRYFESKEALVNALYQKWKTALLDHILDGFPEQAPFREQFHVFWQRYASFAQEFPMAFQFLELHHHSPYLDERSRLTEQKGHQRMVELFHENQRLQILKSFEVELLVAFVWGALSGVLKAGLKGDFPLTQEMIDAAEACCWEAIRR